MITNIYVPSFHSGRTTRQHLPASLQLVGWCVGMWMEVMGTLHRLASKTSPQSCVFFNSLCWLAAEHTTEDSEAL